MIPRITVTTDRDLKPKSMEDPKKVWTKDFDKSSCFMQNFKTSVYQIKDTLKANVIIWMLAKCLKKTWEKVLSLDYTSQFQWNINKEKDI